MKKADHHTLRRSLFIPGFFLCIAGLMEVNNKPYSSEVKILVSVGLIILAIGCFFALLWSFVSTSTNPQYPSLKE